MPILSTTTVNDINKAVKNIAKYTQINNHTEAALELARLLEDKEAIEKLEGIDKKHMRIGHMPYEMGQERYNILKGLWVATHVKFGTEVHDLIKSKF